jgi:CRISPR system Cascade subunit CasA
VYSQAQRGRIQAFTALRPHQWQAWHCLLAQLAALALEKSGKSELPNSAQGWSELLRHLTGQWPNDEPWHLVVDDWRQPAFLQMPTPAGSEKEYKQTVMASDQLDMLVTSKNHDLKTGAARQPQPDDWLFALVTLQTTEGFLGAGNYGISRMNGGFSSRCFVGLSPANGIGAHLIRDIHALLAIRSDVQQAYRPLYPNGSQGDGLIWLQEWDGKSSRSMSGLDPYYIDVCRRVRLQVSQDGTDSLLARVANSKKARIDAAALNGNTGDPWAPVQPGEDAKALTLDARGFHYKRIVELMLDNSWTHSPMSQPLPSEEGEELELVFSAFVRGQGKTEGLQQRRVPMGHNVEKIFGKNIETLGALAQEFIKEAEFIQKTLRNSVALISAGAPTAERGRVDLTAISDEDRSRAYRSSDQFDRYVDKWFFEPLWGCWVETDENQQVALRHQWRYQLLQYARKLLREATTSIPKNRHYRRALAQANRFFNAQIYSHMHFNSWLKDYENSPSASTNEGHASD